MAPDALFAIAGKVAVVTGGTGALGGALARGLAERGVKLAVISRSQERADRAAQELPGEAIGLAASVDDRAALEAAAAKVLDRWGKLDILVNSAGGNRPEATTGLDRTFFQIMPEAIRSIVSLNFDGTVLPCQVFGKTMADQGEGAIVNISSMAAFQPLTRVVGYSAAKAAVNNFTQWLAVYMAQNYSPRIRVNAIAPGFFETEQNRFLLRDKDTDELSERGKTIITHTPMGRFGRPDELIGTLIWLVSPASAFVTGVVVPVDGGFAAFSGV